MATITVYGTAKHNYLKGDLALDDGTVGVLLTTTRNGINHAHDTVTNVLATETELVDASYSRQTQTLTGSNLTRTTSTINFDLSDVVFSSLSGGDISLAILYKATGTGGGADDSSRKVIAYIDFVSDITLTGNDISIQWNASGLFDLA